MKNNTVYLVSKTSLGKDIVFRTFQLPDGTTVKILNKDVHEKALKAASKIFKKQ